MRSSDWSSDVCSSDLLELTGLGGVRLHIAMRMAAQTEHQFLLGAALILQRRRVGQNFSADGCRRSNGLHGRQQALGILLEALHVASPVVARPRAEFPGKRAFARNTIKRGASMHYAYMTGT